MKRFLPLFTLLFILISCSSTKDANIISLDMEQSYEGLLIIPEEALGNTMKDEVEPFIKKFLTYGAITSEGHRIFYEYYDIPDEKGSVVVLHGFSEFIEKYNEVIWYFLSEGYDVYLIEHFGHGFSERDNTNMSKVDVKDFQTYVSDVNSFIEEIVLPLSDDTKPLFLFAHSMGGGIGVRYLETYPGVFDAAVLSAPMLGVNMGAIPQPIATFFASSAKLFGQGDEYVFGHYDWDGVEDYENSSAKSYERYRYAFSKREEMKYWQTYGATWNWLSAAIKATKLMAKEADKITIPLIIFQAEDDTLVRNDKQIKFASKVPTSTLIKVPSSKHEIFNSSNDVVKPYWSTIFTFFDDVSETLARRKQEG